MNFRWGLNITGALVLIISQGCKKPSVYTNTVVYGHAGTTLYSERWIFPANTVESVLYAFDVLDADGTEVDVQMTKDSVLVLYHDAYLDENTRLSGCIPQYNFVELNNLNLYNSKYNLARLDEVVKICFDMNKELYLDLKPYHYCDSKDVDLAVFNNAFNKILMPYSENQKMNLVVNSRNMELLNVISDTNVVKSFETENLDFAIEKYLAGEIDEVCLNSVVMSREIKTKLNDTGLNFTIFGVKTEREISTALSFSPLRVITDNIAYTKKLIK